MAVYQYMRLIGYPAKKISILTPYNGQKALIQDVLKQRCGWSKAFGEPAAIATVDKYQGQQNDCTSSLLLTIDILLSLVRTKALGHLRDIRRMIVAFSRARLGLYVFCRQSLFQQHFDPIFSQLSEKPSKLSLQVGEYFDQVTRKEADACEDPFLVDGLSHIGAYVFQMCQDQMLHEKKE